MQYTLQQNLAFQQQHAAQNASVQTGVPVNTGTKIVVYVFISLVHSPPQNEPEWLRTLMKVNPKLLETMAKRAGTPPY